jgi:hypothetical protein
MIAQTPASASGVFDLDSQSTFQQAINGGLLAPVTAWDPGMEFAFPGEMANFVPASLSTNSHGLVVSVEADMPVNDFAWDYLYGVDPDLANKDIKKTAMVGALEPGVTAQIVIELTDSAGKMKSWTENVAAAGNVMIDIKADGGKQGLDGFKEEAGFDIKKVTVIKDLVKYIQPKDVSVPLDVVETAFAVTVPEPSTWAMLVAGFASLGLVGHRQSRKRTALAA